MIKLACMALVVAALTGCAGIPNTYTTTTPFDLAATTALLAEGSNSITGNAFMRQAGGGVVTCAGSTVFLIPGTAYAAERVRLIYGNVDAGQTRQSTIFKPEQPEYERLTKKTTCDSSGNFQFDKIADGDFFVLTEVRWMVGTYNTQGAAMIKAVKVSKKQQVKIVMAG